MVGAGGGDSLKATQGQRNPVAATNSKTKTKTKIRNYPKIVPTILPLVLTVCGILTGLSSPTSGGAVVEISAYSSVESCHTGRDCLMASGRQAYIGSVACPRTLKLGTRVVIGGLGEFVCEDRTAERLEGRFDVFMGYGGEAYQRAKNFGLKKLKVEIIK